VIYTISVALIFLFTAAMFLIYNRLVEHRNTVVMKSANETHAIVSNLFPKGFRDRLVHREGREMDSRENKWLAHVARNMPKRGLSTFVRDGDSHTKQITMPMSSKPLADLYPESTLMFADVVGFTAWSSVREPSQVFILLETLYQAFDEIAKRRRVFKVETVGDCYVAVAGVPDPQKEHAVVMARFASECMTKMYSLTKELEVSLGPDTGDLSMRIGLHSGPVIAGVLRGDRARFQLFGDTVNTTARIESTGARRAIHVSQETADLLIAAGKPHWVKPRGEKVAA
jgi:class 3 adenylate cyclase